MLVQQRKRLCNIYNGILESSPSANSVFYTRNHSPIKDARSSPPTLSKKKTIVGLSWSTVCDSCNVEDEAYLKEAFFVGTKKLKVIRIVLELVYVCVCVLPYAFTSGTRLSTQCGSLDAQLPKSSKQPVYSMHVHANINNEKRGDQDARPYYNVSRFMFGSVLMQSYSQVCPIWITPTSKQQQALSRELHLPRQRLGYGFALSGVMCAHIEV